MLRYTTRIRDIIHGFVQLTDLERDVVDHPFFQRLRHVRQTDVTFYVYPSLNGTRFEHSLGACHLAGRMAQSIMRSRLWPTYFQELKQETDITTEQQFVQLARLYALLHDIGHFPLSHLFEAAFDNHVRSKGLRIKAVTETWTSKAGFTKLHEALGAALVERIAEDVSIAEPMRTCLITLMTQKELQLRHALFVIKELVDSEVDADRMDSIKRDGLLAGSEYGNYDIDRLSTSVFVERDERGWLLAYSEKSLTSLEAMLLDRYRSYLWIHFHHKAVEMKTLVRFLIETVLDGELITPEHFKPSDPGTLLTHDDVWLWGLIRNLEPDDHFVKIAKEAVLHRKKDNVLNLWKGRIDYHLLIRDVEKKARVTNAEDRVLDPGIYEQHMGEVLGAKVLEHDLRKFEPISDRAICLCSEHDGQLTTHLRAVSELVDNLERIWKDEPPRYLLLLGDDIAAQKPRKRQEWVEAEAQLLRK